MEILRVEHLSKVYGKGDTAVKALDNVSFSVQKGEFVAIIGPSGSGKSTLLHILGGVDIPTAGKVYIDGTDAVSYTHLSANFCTQVFFQHQRRIIRQLSLAQAFDIQIVFPVHQRVCRQLPGCKFLVDDGIGPFVFRQGLFHMHVEHGAGYRLSLIHI